MKQTMAKHKITMKTLEINISSPLALNSAVLLRALSLLGMQALLVVKVLLLGLARDLCLAGFKDN